MICTVTDRRVNIYSDGTLVCRYDREHPQRTIVPPPDVAVKVIAAASQRLSDLQQLYLASSCREIVLKNLILGSPSTLNTNNHEIKAKALALLAELEKQNKKTVELSRSKSLLQLEVTQLKQNQQVFSIALVALSAILVYVAIRRHRSSQTM